MISEKGESSYNLFEEGDARGSFAMRARDAGSDMGCYGMGSLCHPTLQITR